MTEQCGKSSGVVVVTAGPSSAEMMRCESELRSKRTVARSLLDFPKNHEVRNFSNFTQLPSASKFTQ